MFEKAIEKITRALAAVSLKDPPLENGRVVDTLSRESFPARPDIAAALEVDITTFKMAILMGPGHIPLPPSWRLRLKQPDGSEHTYTMDEELRNRLLADLRQQVAEHGRVTDVPLPRLSGWLSTEKDRSTAP